MSGDTTYQALKRLSYLLERDALDNGSVIAGQDYDNVYFIGGNGQNLILTNCTINGLLYAVSLRVFTASGDTSIITTDNVVIINKITGGATIATLPASPATNQYVVIKDGKGDANTNNITISGNGKDIDGGSSYVIGSSYGALTIIWNGTQWNIIA